MKQRHYIADDVDVNINVAIPAEELESLIDKATDAVVTIIVVATAAHILRKWTT
jgi:hypothetical protein